jgi:hypothetical protein
MKNNKCPECGNELKEVEVKIEDADTTVKSFQCPSCNYIEFDSKDSKEVISELKGKEENKLHEIEMKLKEYNRRLKILESYHSLKN